MADELQIPNASHAVPRRHVLIGATGIAAAAAAGGFLTGGPATAASPRAPRPRAKGDPFTLGVASGDPSARSVILWTRLAVAPLDPDGGMPSRGIDVQWEIARDEQFSAVVSRGTAVARPGYGHSVHIDADGLEPDSVYYYRFRQGQYVSPTGRTRTTPAAGSMGSGLVFGQTSCANWQSGTYQLYGDLADAQVDYWLSLGDYIYEYGDGGYVRADRDPVRTIPWENETVTIGDYRRQYGLYRSDEDLQRLHATAPYSVVWDDHEVDNNYTAGRNGGDGQDVPGKFSARRQAGYRAFWENHAVRIRRPRRTDWTLRLYRSVRWGDLAEFCLLDGRQYRSDQPGDNTPNDFGGWVEGMFDEKSTMLGRAQESWLKRRLGSSRATWNFVAQQTVMADVNGGVAFGLPATGLYNYDSWDGYWAARDRFVQTLRSTGVSNPVVLTGDFHTNLAFDVLDAWPDPRDFSSMAEQTAATKEWSAEVVAAEICAGAVSSPGFFAGDDLVSRAGPGTLANTPWAKYGELKTNGVVIHSVTPDADRAQYRVCDAAEGRDTDEGRPRADRTIVVSNGIPGISAVE